jgi:hypothetical protein
MLSPAGSTSRPLGLESTSSVRPALALCRARWRRRIDNRWGRPGAAPSALKKRRPAASVGEFAAGALHPPRTAPWGARSSSMAWTVTGLSKELRDSRPPRMALSSSSVVAMLPAGPRPVSFRVRSRPGVSRSAMPERRLLVEIEMRRGGRFSRTSAHLRRPKSLKGSPGRASSVGTPWDGLAHESALQPRPETVRNRGDEDRPQWSRRLAYQNKRS